MAKTPPDKTIQSVKDRMIESALYLASLSPWSEVTLQQIAQEAGVEFSQAQEYFDDKADVLAAYGRLLDKKVAESYHSDQSLSHRELIFDILMERFDLLNEERAAMTSVLDSLRADPKLAVLGLPHVGTSMMRMATLAGIDTQGLGGCTKIAALTMIYLYVLRTWKEDNTQDMSKTMAALDKALDKAENAYNFLPII